MPTTHDHNQDHVTTTKNLKHQELVRISKKQDMNLPTVLKASKRNLPKKVSRYAKKARLEKDDLYEESEEIFYDPNKVS